MSPPSYFYIFDSYIEWVSDMPSEQNICLAMPSYCVINDYSRFVPEQDDELDCHSFRSLKQQAVQTLWLLWLGAKHNLSPYINTTCLGTAYSYCLVLPYLAPNPGSSHFIWKIHMSSCLLFLISWQVINIINSA